MVVLPACLTQEEAARSADAEAYALIAARTEDLFGEAGPFSIDPPEDSVRGRVLRGEWDGGEPLSLLACLEIAAENNRQYRSRREGLYRDALSLTLEQWRFSLRPFAGGGGSLTGTGDEAQSASTDFGAGVSRTLGTGAQILGNIGASLFRFVNTGDGWDAVSDLSLSITQPLLRGSSRLVVTESLTQAERNLVYGVRDYERFRRTFALDVARRYFSLLRARDQLENQKRNLESLLALRERNDALFEAGELSGIEVDQARQNELSSENSVQRQVASLESQLDSFKLFLGLPIGMEFTLDAGEFDRIEVTMAELGGIDSPELVEVALAERLDLANEQGAVDDAERAVLIAADGLRAGLGVSASGSSSSSEGRPLDHALDRTGWSLSLDLDLPVDQLPERNSYRTALISLEATRRGYEESLDTITADVRDSLRQARSDTASYELERQAVALAERRVESAELSQEMGRASTRDVLESQDDLLAARNSATGARIDSYLTLLQLYLDLEALRVDDSGIWVDRSILPNAEGADEPTEDPGEDPTVNPEEGTNDGQE